MLLTILKYCYLRGVTNTKNEKKHCMNNPNLLFDKKKNPTNVHANHTS